MPGPLALANLSVAELRSHPELAALRRFAEAGYVLAPLRIVQEDTEETFYRLNNLPTQLSALFADLELANPDEDDLEERAPDAQHLIHGHFLLDEVVDLFYEGLEELPAQLRVRRLNSPDVTCPGRVVNRGRPALLALKDTWSDDWSFEALWGRARAEGSIALAARPVLLTASGQHDAGDKLAGQASALLKRRVRLLQDQEFGLTGVRFL